MTSDGHRVTVHWQAESDDALLLGVELELVDPERLDWSPEGPQAADAAELLLPSSGELRRYLLERIRVIQDGAVCEGEVEHFTDFAADGATTVHSCPAPVEQVQLEIGMLHDVHAAYRTFVRSSGAAQPDQAVFTAREPRHAWTFGASGSGGGTVAWLQVTAVALLASLLAGLALRRRRRRVESERASEPAHPAGRTRDVSRTTMHGLLPLAVLATSTEPSGFGWLEDEFLGFIDRPDVSVPLGAAAVVGAFAIGAAHALAPGHGKGLIGAYLVGTRGHAGDAVTLGTIVAVMHCASVLVLGGILFTTLSMHGGVGAVVPWMGVAAGALVIAVGVGLVAHQVRERAARSVPVTGHDTPHGTGQDPPHHGHGHAHLLADAPPLSRRAIVALGVSGGLLPSPSAFLVLASAIVMGRALFGFLLVLAFSLGLACTLTVFGLAAIKGRVLIERRAAISAPFRRLTAVLPLLSSVAVLVGGLWITTAAVLQF
ncbi:MAG: hypothetical protein GEU93_13790 [Propionibacteriales bacterium]|nr:hypothetical protein [Propionibacteriales bacterium]